MLAAREIVKMKLIGSMGLIGLLVVGVAAGAYADEASVKQRELKQDSDLINDAKNTAKECGIDIPIKFDWTNAPQDLIMTNSPESFCDNMLYSVRRICGDADGKAAVKEKIKTISCGFGPERSMSLKDGTLDYKINFDSSNDADYAYEFLQNNL
jgi:hypothetical protein